MSDWRHLARRGAAYHTAGVLFSVAGVAIVTGVIFGLREIAPVVSLGVLYLFAVLPVAVVWGLAYAIPVSVLSMLAFNWFFLPPKHTFALRDSENWVALAVYLFTAVVVSELAARSRRRAADAEQREREASLLAAASAGLLRSGDVQSQLRAIAAGTARALGVDSARIELDSLRRPSADESARDLQVEARKVGRLVLQAGATTDPAAEARLLPTLASLLAVASDRERLGRKALEAEALRRSDAAKTAVLRSVSHDLRSPLTAIRAASEGLESGALELTDADRAALLETIRIEARRLDRLVANLLDLSLLEADAARPEPALWTVDDLIARALDAVGADADRVIAALPNEPPLLQVDAGQVERALANVIENALKFSPQGEPVDVAASVTGGEVIVRVSDRGPGIPPQEHGRIFEPFSRGRSGGGSGLGLAIALGFAQANGGRLWVEPRKGPGATFVLALPVAELPAPVA
jgi:two-component system sensor histidine kinase KdpD